MSGEVLLFWHPASMNAWRPKICLLEKNIPHHIQIINLLAGEHKQEAFLKVTRRHQVPALVHSFLDSSGKQNEVIIYESVAICEYLDRAFPTPPLMPSSLCDLSISIMRIAEWNQKLDPKHFFGSAFFGSKGKEQMEEKITKLKEEISIWEDYLEGREYLANTFSLADIAIYPNIKMLVVGFAIKLERYPNLQKWFQKMEQRPSVRATVSEFENMEKPWLREELKGWLD